MPDIEDLFRKRKELLSRIDEEIRDTYTREVTLLFTDIVGSTRYFERMGDIEGRQMVQTHNDLLFPIIERHGGTVIKTIGDSIMASYEDPLKAVNSAVEMQKALKRLNEKRSPGTGIHVRMGLHYGKAVVEEKDLFGDMVNASARVESLADGEEILISSSLKTQIDNSGLPFVFLGTETVKGKEQEIGFFLVNWNDRSEEEISSSWENRKKKKQAAPDGTKGPDRGVQLSIQKLPDLKVLAAERSPLSKSGNPFLNRVMIPHPDLFFGRQQTVKRIMNRLSGEHPQSVSIVGERRIGKSSLLKYLSFPETRIRLLTPPESYIFLLLDFQQMRKITEAEIVSEMIDGIIQAIGKGGSISVPGDFDGLKLICEYFTEKGIKLIFLFDEFECVTKNESIGPEFYSYLRSLANNYTLGFVTASGKNLKDMCVSRAISDSPFFNIFATLNLTLFRKKEAESLISGLSKFGKIDLAPLKEEILSLGGDYPFFLQMACSSWYDFLEEEEKEAAGFVEKTIPRQVRDLFREEAEPHFEYILETLSEKERAALKQSSAAAPLDPEDPFVRELLRKGYLMENDEGNILPFSKEFGRFIETYLL